MITTACLNRQNGGGKTKIRARETRLTLAGPEDQIFSCTWIRDGLR